MVKLQAHRGVSSEYPENTMAAFRASVEQGYDLIEFDPKYTKDGRIVILHDHTLDRTARKGGTPAPQGTRIYDLTLAQARKYEYGSWFSPEFEGEQLPLLTELLELAALHGIPLKIDNVWEGFPEQMQERMFAEIEPYADKLKLGFTCARLETMERAAKRFPTADIHYDGGDLSHERLREVARIAAGHHLYVWVCFDNEMTAWFKGSKASEVLCREVEKYGEMGVWILSKREELYPAIKQFNAALIETTGHIKPSWVREVCEEKE